MKFTLYTADCTGNAKNTIYPNQKVITSEADLRKAVTFDHVCALYTNNARSDANFQLSDVVPMDCDNDHSDNPDEWITPEKLSEMLSDVEFAITYSRHHMLSKGSVSARPRFHVFFPTTPCKDAAFHKNIKTRIYKELPFFDGNALDASRFLYGSKGDVIWHEGSLTIEDWLTLMKSSRSIPQGQRNSTMSRMAGKVRPFVKRIIGLTGTPCSNGLMDLWAQFRLLDKGERLGKRIGQYRDAYFTPDWNGFTYSPRPGAEKQIYSKIADISISMKTTDHLKMPELVMTADSVELDEAAATFYKEMEQEMCLDFTRDSITAANAGVLCGKLTQLASGSVYTDGGSVMRIHSHKLDALEDLIEAQNGKPVLIAYWYKHERDSIMERFDCREIKTDADIANWNKGKIPVALIQPSSAGHGLNLQDGGSTIIWYTMPWSLELYQQTNARLWRQGQQSETVVIHHLVAAGTIDEDIMKVLENKDKTQAAMMKAVKARVRE